MGSFLHSNTSLLAGLPSAARLYWSNFLFCCGVSCVAFFLFFFLLISFFSPLCIFIWSSMTLVWCPVPGMLSAQPEVHGKSWPRRKDQRTEDSRRWTQDYKWRPRSPFCGMLTRRSNGCTSPPPAKTNSTTLDVSEETSPAVWGISGEPAVWTRTGRL